MSDLRNPKRYVVGLLFDDEREYVVLIRKNRPSWQDGLLNGPGGKVDPCDPTIHHAIAREVLEETGVVTEPEAWTPFCNLLEYEGDDRLAAIVDFLWAVAPYPDVQDAETMTDEPVAAYRVEEIVIGPEGISTTPNLPWLVSMAMDTMTNPRYSITTTARYDLRDGIGFEDV